MKKANQTYLFILFTGIISLVLCIGGNCISQPLSLLLLHVNDTHSHIDPETYTVPINGVPTKIRLGGFDRLMTALNEERARDKNILFLHAGDIFQGTLYFFEFQGQADEAFLNLMNLDAMVLGNHEFDRSSALLAGFIDGAQFPALSANIDVSADPVLRGKIVPFIIREVEGEKVGIIGLTTPDTTTISSPESTVLFNFPVPGARAAVAELEKQGINKIMVLSHLGVEEDIKLAQQVSGIDVIVGGHSHTLMGNFSAFAYHTSYSYPLHQKDPDGKDVLIVQAWEWAKVLGKIRLTFDDAGNVVDDQPNPVFIVGEAFDQKWQDTNGDGQVNEKDAYTPVTQENAPDRYRSIVQYINQSGQARIFAEDPPGKQLRDRYCLNVQKLKGTVIAQSPVDLTRNGMNSGPGPLIAAGMLEKTAHMGAQMALLNPGGVRVDIPAGPVSISTVYDLIPFQSTLVLVTLTGQEMDNALEDMVDFCLSENGYGAGIYAYVAGVHFSLDLTSPRGQRVFDLKIRQKDGAYQTAQPQETYHLVTLNFLAEGGDKNLTLGKIQNKVDTGFVDADVFMEYIKGKTLQEPSEELVTLSSGD